MGNTKESRVSFLDADKLLVGFENVKIEQQKKSLTLCYANCILQVLLHHPIFIEIIKSCPKQDGLIGQIRNLYKGMKSKKPKTAISTLKLMAYIEKESGIFNRQHHQDSHQFYIWLMNQINDQIKGKSKQMTKLEEQFASKRITQTVCDQCKKISQREEEEVDLSLILPEPNVSLNYCIENYSAQEKMVGTNKFKCGNCQTLQNAMKKTLIKTLPNFLSIHLRRFVYDQAKKGIKKLMWLIPFPFKIKIKTNHKPQNMKQVLYRLVGVVAHIGTGGSYGHYVACIKINNQWFYFNDDEITEVDDYMLESLWGYKGVTKCAYMLFYSI